MVRRIEDETLQSQPVKRSSRLLFGPLAGIILACGITGLALLIPGYSHVRQTVSEIGELGSAARVPFAVMLIAVAICLIIFATAMSELLALAGHSRWGAWLIGFMALPSTGLAVFAFPHPLHNVFGLSETIGYLAPLIIALTWRNDPRRKSLVTISWIFFVIVWVTIALNLSPIVPAVWVHLKPVHGLVQRALFAAWFGWCAVVGLLLRFNYSEK